MPTCRGGSYGPFHVPARIIAAVGPLLFIVLGLVALGAGCSCCAASVRATASGGSWQSTPVGQRGRGARPGRRSGPLRRRSRDGSTPRTSSRTTPTARSSCAARRIQLAARLGLGDGRRAHDRRRLRAPRGARCDRSSTTQRSMTASSSSRASPSGAPRMHPTGSRPARRPTTPMRLRVEQVSSVEHAVVLGVPDSRPR